MIQWLQHWNLAGIGFVILCAIWFIMAAIDSHYNPDTESYKVEPRDWRKY